MILYIIGFFFANGIFMVNMKNKNSGKEIFTIFLLSFIWPLALGMVLGMAIKKVNDNEAMQKASMDV